MSHRVCTDVPPVDPPQHDLARRITALPPPALPDDDAEPRRSRRRPRAGAAPWRERLVDRVVLVAARTGVTPRAVVGLMLLGVAVALVLLARVLLAHHRADPVPLRVTTASATSPATPGVGDGPAAAVLATPSAGAASPDGDGATAAPTGPVGTVLVHVVGQVRDAGVVRLPSGARVEQALQAAGGATAKADLVRVNLARPVVDGEQIVVPKPGQPIAEAPGGVVTGGGGGAVAGSSRAAQPVDLNTAGLTQLDELPGVGPVLAQRILDWRSQNGRFTTVDELAEVSGIGDKVLERLRPLVRV